MRSILVFDQFNDILYSKCNIQFMRHVKKLGKAQGLIAEDKDDEELSPNVIIQLFSPIVTSQRIMSCQFGNSYSSVQCQDGTNMVFDEHMGYLFVHIGTTDVMWLKRMVGVAISFVKYLCGPNVTLLKSDKCKQAMLSRLLDTYTRLQDADQAVLVEAIEQLMVNSDLSATTMKALHEATDKLKSQTEFTHIHSLVLVENKFLSLYSSRNAQDLSSSDIMFLSILCESLHGTPTSEVEASTSDEESDARSRLDSDSLPAEVESSLMDTLTESVTSHVIMMMGSGAAYNPHAVHIAVLEEGIYLLLIFETGHVTLSAGIFESLSALNTMQNLQLQKDQEGVKHSFEYLDSGVKKVFEGVKKTKSISKPEVESIHRQVQNKWEFIRRKYVEYMKTSELDCVVRIESSTTGFVIALLDLLSASCLSTDTLFQHRDVVIAVVAAFKARLADYTNFLKVKALRNFTLGSRASLTINKYLEEFPGLVHFLYVDRTTHRVTAPSLDFSSEETISLTKKKIWSMVEFTRYHLNDGHLAIMWKDTTFNYAYFLWFEDTSGSPLKPKVFPTGSLKNLPIPGILCGDFYQKLVESCFPKMSPNKIRCYELYCIHLGLATSSCVLEHSRRLAATIWEVTGIPNNPIDLL